jgi:hypothetical protein
MWEYVFASILFLMFIGGIYKYFEEIQIYIIKKILPDKRVANMKCKMAEVDFENTTINQPSKKTPILDSIRHMENYVKDFIFSQFNIPEFSKYL